MPIFLIIMRNNRPIPITNLFKKNNTTFAPFLQIKQKIIILMKMNYIVKSALPTPLKQCCRVINVRNKSVIIETINASWKMRLYYECSKLLILLKSNVNPCLNFIDIKINPKLAKDEELNFLSNKTQIAKNTYFNNEKKLKKFSIKSAAYIYHIANQNKGKMKNILKNLAKLIKEQAKYH